MKKLCRGLIILALCVLPAMALAESGLEAYWLLVNNVQTPADSREAIDWAVKGAYGDQNDASRASALAILAEVTEDELKAYAGESGLPEMYVRHAWYMALAACLEGDIAITPASGNRQQLNVMLQLFLDDGEIDDDDREEIRENLTMEQIALFSEISGLPEAFLVFLLVDDDWDNDDDDDDDD